MCLPGMDGKEEVPLNLTKLLCVTKTSMHDPDLANRSIL